MFTQPLHGPDGRFLLLKKGWVCKIYWSSPGEMMVNVLLARSYASIFAILDEWLQMMNRKVLLVQLPTSHLGAGKRFIRLAYRGFVHHSGWELKNGLSI